MIFRILLLINLISWIHGTLVVDVTQTSYQAEENQDITLEWTFTTRPHMSITSINICCAQFIDQKQFVWFELSEGVEVSYSQDEQFSGRVQFDKDVLREGRIRLQLSRLRTNDSGLYLCKVQTDDGTAVGKCGLNIIAAREESEHKTETNHNTLSWVTGVIYCAVPTVAGFILGYCLGLCYKRCGDKSPTITTVRPNSYYRII